MDSKTSCVNGLQCWLEVFTLLILGAKDLKAENSNSFIDINMNFTHAEMRILGNNVLNLLLVTSDLIIGILRTLHISNYHHFFTGVGG